MIDKTKPKTKAERVAKYLGDKIRDSIPYFLFFVSCIFIALIVSAIFTRAWAYEFKIQTKAHDELEFGNDLNAHFKKEEVVERATDLIISFEGFSKSCYIDGNGLSQGYGHKCIQKTISKDWSKKVVKSAVSDLYDEMVGIYPLASRNRLVGLISYDYNTPNTRPAIKYSDEIKNDDREFVKNHMEKYNSFYKGLEKRREAEFALIFPE